MRKTILGSMTSLLLPFSAYGAPSSYGYQQKNHAVVSSSLLLENLPTSLPVRPQKWVDADALAIEQGVTVRELVVMDAGIAEADKVVLRRALKPGLALVEIDSAKAGLPQLVSALDGYKNLAAIHVVSHAEAGVVLLGNSRITPEAIQQEVHIFAALNGSVREGGDLLFYGCDLAANKAGEELLNIISHKTGLDVAASNNLTGNSELQGDWDLEVKRGNIESTLAFSEKALRDFSGVLAASDGIKTFAGWAGNNMLELSTTDFRLTARDGNNNSRNVGIFDDSIGYIATGTGNANHYLYLRADGTNTTAFELIGLNSGEAPGYAHNFTNVRIVGTVQGGGTVNSSTINGTGAFDESFTFGSDQLAAFSGVKLTGFKLYFDCGTSCSQLADVALFEFRSFTIQGAVDTPPTDSDATVTAAGGVTEPVGLATTIDTIGEAVDVFDFTIADGGTSDGLATTVSQIVVNVSGISTDAERGQITWRLNGPDTSNVTGTYNAGTDTITFSSLSISVADGGNETYTVNARYNNNTGLTDGRTIILSVDGDTNLTGGSGTQMASGQSAVTNGSGTTIDVVANQLVFTTQPAGSVSGAALTTQPVVAARDAFGNVDVDFTETITLTQASAGAFLSNNIQAATGGVATFTNLAYTATADQQIFTLTANDQDGVDSNLPTVDANAVTSDVVATQLVFDTQPAPTSVVSGQNTAFTTVPVVSARDASSILDTGYVTDITLAEVNGAGSATLDATGDTDGSATTVSITPSSGVATFTGMEITYTNIGVSETFNLRASSGGLPTADSSQFTAVATVTVSDISISISGGTGTGGAYKIGDTVTATWNNTADGDNNAGITGVTVDFSEFGGGAAVVATNSGEIWTATYTIVSGAIDATDRNVSVTATNGIDPTTTTDSTNATVDNLAPTVTDAYIGISGASGTDGAYIVGDTVTATWNNSAGGDSNSDIISSATVNFSQFGGGAAVVATNSAGIWTATYTIVGGAINATNRNVAVTATDNAGNAITAAGTTNATVDNMAPTVSSVSVPANATYVAEQSLDFTVNTSQTITVNTGGGTPRIPLTVGADTVYASYISGSGSSALTFRYTVQAGDLDINGIAVGAAIELNGGSLGDASGNNLTLTLNSVNTTSVLVDAVAPNAPTGLDLTVGTDLGVSSTDDLTNDTTPTITGSAEANSTVTLYDTDGTTVLATTTADGIGAWLITSSALADGAHSLTAKATDAAGNESVASAALVVTIDTDLPVATSSTPDGAALPTATSVVFTVAFDDTVYGLSADDFSLATTDTVVGTVASVSVTSGSEVVVTVNAISGTGTLRLDTTGAGITDLAGNLAPAFTAGTAHSVDLDAPTITSVTFDQVSVDSGNQAAISFTLAGAETSATANYTITGSNGGTPVTGSLTISSAGQQITGVNVGGLNDGTLTISLTLTDAAGNESSPAVTDTISKDANVPAVTSVATANGNYRAGDTISVAVTLDEDVDVVGTNSTIALEVGGETRLAAFVSENAGVLIYSYTVVADDNTDATGVTVIANSITLNGDTIRDAGNNDASLVFSQFSNASAQVDTAAPVNPMVIDPAMAISVNTPDYEVIGTHAENNVVINLYADADNDGVADNATVIANATVAAGLWSVVEPILSANSANNYVVIAEDAAGNVSATIDVPTITHDDIAPAAPAALDLAVASDTGSSDVDNITNDATPTITGTAEANATVTLSSDLDDEVGTAVADGAGDWSITASALSVGEHILTATATDAADNTGAASTSLIVTVDTEVPTITDIADQGVALGGSTGALAFILADNLTAAADLTLTTDSSNVTAVPLANVVLDGTGANRTVTVTGATSGASTITVTVADLAGNTASDTFVVGVNSTPTIGGTPAINVNQDVAYSFTPTAADVDGDGLIFGITNSPAWASFDTATGALTGTPTRASVGTYSNILISVSDGTVSASLPVFAIEVVYVNAAPTISGTPAISVDQDVAYSFVPTAGDSDPDDTLTFSIANQPAWASFDTATGALTGAPTRDNVGSFAGIVISVSDGSVSASLPAFAIEVGYVNAAPEITGSPAVLALVGSAYTFAPAASDSDDDELTFSATGLPAWLTLDTETGLLSGTPAAADADTSTDITLSVSDGSASDTLPAFTLAVEYDGAAPVVEAPAAVTLNATALYTPVSLRQLLGLSPAASQEDIDEALAALASDSTSGNACCTTRPDGLSANNLLLLPPGRHEIVWQATNEEGLTASASQILDLRPLVSFSKQQVAVRDSEISLRVILNGPSPVYPLDIPYMIDAATTALPDEHSLTDGVASFTEAGQLEVFIPVQLAAINGASDSELVLRLDDESAAGEPVTDSLFDINAGAANHHIISIREGNVAPAVSLQLTQGGLPTSLIAPDAGPVTATAVVVDPNPGDTHSYDWTATSDALIDSDGDMSNTTWVFDPTGLDGRYFLQMVATDSAGDRGMTRQYFRVVSELPVLDPALDSDGDGIDDLTEGFGDTSGNGIPDYLDNMPSSNIMPQVIALTDAYLIECDPGVRCRLGAFALMGNSGGVQILNDEVALGFEITPDESFEPVGGIFDFEIKDLPTPGQNVRVVIPQQAAIPANAVYRKFQNGSWVNFMEDANNALHSTAGNLGYCPPPGSADWQSGLTEGHFCVQLTLQDGGPNDADGEINAAVVDPGAVSSALPVIPPVEPPAPPTQVKSKGGGAMHGIWLMLMAGLLAIRQPRRLRARLTVVVALVLAALNTQAQTLADDLYLRADLYRVEGNQTAQGYSSALANDGHGITLTDYTILRRGYQLALGYRWNEFTYSELGYLDLGSVRVDLLRSAGDDVAGLERSFAKHYPRTGNGITLVQGVTYPLNTDVSIAAELGAFVWRNEVDVREGLPSPKDTDGTAPLLGVQLNFKLSEPLMVGLGIRRVFFDDEAVDLWGVSARWAF